MKCALCGLDSADAEFCCAGCENVYSILRESGVLESGQSFRDTELFRESLRLGLIAKPTETSPPRLEGETREAVFQISGMWCASCGWLIEHALAKTLGVVSAEVLFASDLLKVRYCPRYLPPERIVERVRSLGYRAAEPGEERSDAERKDLLLRLGVAAFLWLNVMTFSLVIYASYFERVTASFGRYVPFLLMALATPAVFYCAAPVLRIAWAGVRNRVLRMETLLALGILSAYGYSAVSAVLGDRHVYFDTVCALVTLVLAGKAIERTAKAKTVRAITLLYRLMPSKARVITDGGERFVSVEALTPGTSFRVLSGERIPADGIVRDGRSHADESVLTGESAPLSKGPGDTVVCGSINLGGVLEVEATHAGADSTLARMVRTVEQASANRTQTERAVDRLARLFIPAVLALSALTFGGWQWHTGRPAEALLHAIAVLVIACPCALGIATPLALTAAVAHASRRGILVSDARALETIRDINVVVLDKTGTATEGRFELLEAIGDTSRMAELAAVEARSEHPIGKALAARAAGLDCREVAVEAGRGISGIVGEARYFLGNRRWVEGLTGHSASVPRLEQTEVCFGWDGEVRGALSFGDRVRPDAVALTEALRRRGVRTVLLSGDSRAATERVARELGADAWHAEATPDRKVEILRELQQSGARVAMIGDGVNDAPGLAQANLGIAMGSGTDIAMQAAPLILMGSSLGAVTEALDLARRAFRIVRQNLAWAFVYNAAGITLAIVGVLNPILAAGAMVLSSLSVIGNSRRLG